jgi:hypothetical protein
MRRKRGIRRILVRRQKELRIRKELKKDRTVRGQKDFENGARTDLGEGQRNFE